VQAARQPVRLDGSRGRCCGLGVIGDLQWTGGLDAGDWQAEAGEIAEKCEEKESGRGLYFISETLFCGPCRLCSTLLRGRPHLKQGSSTGFGPGHILASQRFLRIVHLL
jgi:hypothetical protein